MVGWSLGNVDSILKSSHFALRFRKQGFLSECTERDRRSIIETALEFYMFRHINGAIIRTKSKKNICNSKRQWPYRGLPSLGENWGSVPHVPASRVSDQTQNSKRVLPEGGAIPVSKAGCTRVEKVVEVSRARYHDYQFALCKQCVCVITTRIFSQSRGLKQDTPSSSGRAAPLLAEPRFGAGPQPYRSLFKSMRSPKQVILLRRLKESQFRDDVCFLEPINCPLSFVLMDGWFSAFYFYLFTYPRMWAGGLKESAHASSFHKMLVLRHFFPLPREVTKPQMGDDICSVAHGAGVSDGRTLSGTEMRQFAEVLGTSVRREDRKPSWKTNSNAPSLYSNLINDFPDHSSACSFKTLPLGFRVVVDFSRLGSSFLRAPPGSTTRRKKRLPASVAKWYIVLDRTADDWEIGARISVGSAKWARVHRFQSRLVFFGGGEEV
uniref:Uncharacterized protein n=1 Tax=Timema monikensis TaxID=170555 RepID=A0A7R9HSH0_9NEOP|nr:unnamed protein product [Timema monikensis]